MNPAATKTTTITSPPHLIELLGSATVVFINFYASGSVASKVIDPIFERFSEKFSRPGELAFAKCEEGQVASAYGVTVFPTFILFQQSVEVKRVQGADKEELVEAIAVLIRQMAPGDPSSAAAATPASGAAAGGAGGGAGSGGGGGGGGGGDGGGVEFWLGNAVPEPYGNVTDQTDLKDLELLNSNPELGHVKVLFDAKRPSQALERGKGKGKGKDDGQGGGEGGDWVESDTDQQLMLFMSFRSTVKLHTIQITSLALAPRDEGYDEADDEVPSRPRTVKVWANPAQILSFEEGEDLDATHEIVINSSDWNGETGTVSVPLRFVKFQSVSSLGVFFVDVERDGAEKVRVDRLRLIGEAGEKREMGKLEKVGDLSGE